MSSSFYSSLLAMALLSKKIAEGDIVIDTSNEKQIIIKGRQNETFKSIQHNEKGLSESDKARIDRANAKRALKAARRLEIRG